MFFSCNVVQYMSRFEWYGIFEWWVKNSVEVTMAYLKPHCYICEQWHIEIALDIKIASQHKKYAQSDSMYSACGLCVQHV
jgi:hypothetical protein